MLKRNSFARPSHDRYENFHAEPGNGWANDMPPVQNPGQMQTPYDYFRKPKQPENLLGNMPINRPGNDTSGIMAYFQNDEGELDLDKVFAATGQMTSLFQRVMPIVMRLASVARGSGG